MHFFEVDSYEVTTRICRQRRIRPRRRRSPCGRRTASTRRPRPATARSTRCTSALRKCLSKLYPQIADVRLTDYKVRVLDSNKGTAANVRVLIEWSDHRKSWSTVGVSDNVIEASWKALVDAIRLELMRLTEQDDVDREGRRRLLLGRVAGALHSCHEERVPRPSSSGTAPGSWPTAPKCPGRMAKARVVRNAFGTSARQSPSYWSSGARIPSARFRPRSARACRRRMRRERLLRHLRFRGYILRREGKRAFAVGKPVQRGHAEAVPRHSEIANLLAKRICRKLSVPDPHG